MSTKQPSQPGDQSAPAKKPAPEVFNVPWLLGKPIDEIRDILGKPEDTQPEPSNLQLQVGIEEWQNVFTKGEQELLVTFNARTRRVKDFFLPGEDKTVLLQREHLIETAATYQIEAVKETGNPSKITGIKIIPFRTATAPPKPESRPEPQSQPQSQPKPEGRMRTWTDNTRKHTVEAEFVSFGRGQVKLRKADGQEISVLIERLCEEDQKWIRDKF